MGPGHASCYDALIVGAGIAGCALARALARQGRSVLIIDRNLVEPDRIVRELFQPDGVEGLKRLGLDECLEGIEATPVKGYHLYWKGEEASFWFCPTVVTNAEGEPETKTCAGRSFHHGRLVAKLRDAIRGDPTTILLEATVHEVLRDSITGRVVGVGCSVDAGSSSHEYYADLVVLADGANSNFRSQFTPFRPKAQSRFWSLELSNIQLPIPHIRETRILIDIFNKVYDKLGDKDAVRAYISDRVLPMIPANLRQVLREALEMGRLRSMPNSWMPATRNRTPGLLLLGDAGNMRHPMTGAVMTVAIKDTILLSELLCPKEIPSFLDTGHVLKALTKFHWQRKYHSAPLNILAQALYLLFASEGRSITIIQRGFITFVQGGDKNFAGPAALMGGITDKPFLLILHFVGIAFFSVWLHISAALILVPAVVDELRS